MPTRTNLATNPLQGFYLAKCFRWAFPLPNRCTLPGLEALRGVSLPFSGKGQPTASLKALPLPLGRKDKAEKLPCPSFNSLWAVKPVKQNLPFLQKTQKRVFRLTGRDVAGFIPGARHKAAGITGCCINPFAFCRFRNVLHNCYLWD